VNRTRDFSFAARLSSVAGMVVFGVLLLGSQPGSATPVPVGPTDIQPPIVTPLPPLPPKPKPCVVIKCVPPTLEPCFVKPEDCQPPSTPPTKPPTLTPRPPKSTTPTTPTTPPTQTTPTGSIPTPNRIDTGGGPGGDAPTWLFWVVPALGVLTLAAGTSGWWLARSEQREH
jgi:hypothetical protein